MKYYILPLVLILSGCFATVAEKTVIQRVEVPVYVIPELPIVEIGILPIDSISDQSTDGEVVTKYVATIKLLKSKLEEIKVMLDAIRK
jgi:hypothetical protein